MKSIIKRILLVISETAGLAACMLLSVFPLSCRVSVSGLEIIGTDCKVPELETYEILDEKNITMTFSDEVNLISSGITESESENPKSLETECTKSEDGKTIFIFIPEGTQVGKNYIFTGEVENQTGSSLTFSYNFTGYNAYVPKLILTEIMDETRKYSKNKIEHKIYEFIEFYALTDGNLSGLRILSVNDGEPKAFYFPNIEIKAGDFITVHYRKNSLDGDLCESELDGDIAACQAEGSSEKAWDFYIDNTEARFGASQDIVILENTGSGKILQSIIYSKAGKNAWSKDTFGEYQKKCITNGVWLGEGNLEEAVSFENSANFARNNLSEIVLKFQEGELEWPLPSDNTEWTPFKAAAFTPGYCDIF